MPKRSHVTQVMQNYFDSTDTRARESAVSLEAQLLNMAALELEDLDMRITRENSQTLQTVPTNIDNGGVYYGGRVPDAVIVDPNQTEFNDVVGKRGSTYTTLQPYNDQLPEPTRIELDSTNLVPFSNPVIFSLIGSGDTTTQIWTTQYVEPGAFPIPNKLILWMDQLGLNEPTVVLTIVGETAPQPAWVAERKKTTEVITIKLEGHVVTRNRWSVIDKIAVRGLPLGVRLQGWSMPFNLPAVPDDARPYTTPEDRDVTFPRYWQISNSESLLKEMYRADGLTGLEIVNTYLINDSLVDVAVEPNTNGMYAVSGTTLYYADRREDMPDVTQTGISAEPLYGLQVVPDITKTGYIRYVILSGIPYGNAANISQYRYVLNGQSTILPGGAIGPMNAGWRAGAPESISFPLLTTGDYQFRLEMQDINGVTTYDVVPYKNREFTPLVHLDISGLIDVVKGMGFDSYGKLWIWNGFYAIPVKIHYDAYVFDPDSKNIYTTDPFDSLQVS